MNLLLHEATHMVIPPPLLTATHRVSLHPLLSLQRLTWSFPHPISYWGRLTWSFPHPLPSCQRLTWYPFTPSPPYSSSHGHSLTPSPNEGNWYGHPSPPPLLTATHMVNPFTHSLLTATHMATPPPYLQRLSRSPPDGNSVDHLSPSCLHSILLFRNQRPHRCSPWAIWERIRLFFDPYMIQYLRSIHDTVSLLWSYWLKQRGLEQKTSSKQHSTLFKII